MKARYLILCLAFSFLPRPLDANALWIWTPESGKWTNPKHAVLETPQKQLDLVKSEFESENYKATIQEAEKLIKNYPKSLQAPEAQYYIGKSHETLGRLKEAVQEYQLVVDKYPFSERSAEIVRRQFEIGHELFERTRQKKGFFKTVFDFTDTDVIETFRSVIKNAPYGELAPRAQYLVGLFYLEKEMYREARDEFEKVLNDYPDSEWIKAAKYQIAVADAARAGGAHYDQKVTQSAVKEFEEFVQRYPDAEMTGDARKQITDLVSKEAENEFLTAQFYEKQGNVKAARIYYQSVVDEYRNSVWAPKALKRLQGLAKQ